MSRGHLIIRKQSVCLFVDGRYLTVATSQSAIPVEEIKMENQIHFLKGCKFLGYDGSVMTYEEVGVLRKKTRKTRTKLRSCPEVLREIRAVKDASEIRKMKNSAKLAYSAYQFIRKKLKAGITEIELARKLEIYCLEKGAEKMSFEPIIAFGKNSALPHHHPGKTKLKENDLALFDLGVVLDGYCSDMTRVDFVGKEDKILRHLLNVTREAQKMAFSKCKPGIQLKELDVAARNVMKNSDLEHLFVHNLGHGIGLEIHEYPSIGFNGPDRLIALKEGMVVTIEPGLYLPGKGGVRYEDTIVITKNGYENFYPQN